MPSIKELSEERVKLTQENRRVLDSAEKEARGLSAEESQEWDKRDNRIDQIGTEIDGLQADDRRKKRLDEYDKIAKADPVRQILAVAAHDGAALTLRAGRHDVVVRPGTPEHFRATDKYKEVFLSYLADGGRGYERLGLQVGKDPKGGYLTPTQMATDIIKFVDDALWFRQIANVLPPLGSAVSLGALSQDTDPDDFNWTAEVPASDISEDDAVTFGKRELMPHLLTKLIKLSQKIMRSSAIDPWNYMVNRIGYKLRVTQEKAYLTGTGAQQPLGVFTASADGISTGRDVTMASQTVFTADELIDMLYTLKSQYQSVAQWVAHRDWVKRCRKLKDGEGQYLWSPGLNGEPSTILGRPIRQSEFAPNTFTTGRYVSVLGDFKTGYWIVDSLDMQIQQLMELFALRNQVGMVCRSETDGQPVLEECFVRQKLA